MCSDLIIRPDGKIKLCGCTGSPVVGDIWSGISDKGERLMESEEYQNTNCFRGGE